MTASVTYPTATTSGIDLASLTALMGGVVPVISSGGGFDTATWAGLPDETDIVEMLLGLLEIEPNLAVKVQFGTAP